MNLKGPTLPRKAPPAFETKHLKVLKSVELEIDEFNDLMSQGHVINSLELSPRKIVGTH